MPNIRFWRRITIFPGVRLNFSKTGVSITFGKRGFGVTFGRRGIRFTAGIPGSGLFISEHVRHDKLNQNSSSNYKNPDQDFLEKLKGNSNGKKKEK